VTETIVTKTISYFTGTPEVLETVVTTSETISQTKTVVGASNQTISHTAPFFTITPTSGVELTVSIGPTYIIYQSLFGGLDYGPSETGMLTKPTSKSAAPSCTSQVKYLHDLAPKATEVWSYYIQTIAADQELASPEDKPYLLPPGLVDFLKQDPAAQSIFSGSDLATCTVAPTIEPNPSRTTGLFPTFETPGPTNIPPGPPPPLISEPMTTATLITEAPSESMTSTYLSTTYQTTSTQLTVRTCLRCDTDPVPAPPGPSDQNVDDNPKPTYDPSDPAETRKDDQRPPPVIPTITQAPQNAGPPNDQPRVTIGTDTYILYPARPTQANPSQPNQQSPNQPNQQSPNQQSPNQPNQNQPNAENKPTGVVIGTNTLTIGQTTTWNGVKVIVPSSGSGSTIIVGDSSVAVNPAVTAPPVLTVGDKTVTANPQGQFVIGTQTLAPGKPAVTIDGTTLQLGSSGTVAVVNGQTKSLDHAPFPINAPAITIDGQIFAPSVIGGTTVFAIGSQTLTPGGVLTKDGTTYSLPPNGDGSTVIVNGVTSTLAAPGLPILTLGSEGSQSTITASVKGGTTAFVLSPGQTLTPGGVLTISGTTYSLPASASGSVVVINGETSTLGQGPITAAAALTIDGKTYSATVRDGTTEFEVGEGTTLKPGESIVLSGTTYSLDPEGTALIIDGKTSTIPRTPASNSATTTQSSSKSESTSDSSSDSGSTTSRDPAGFIASGLGITESRGDAGSARGQGVDKLVEGAVIGLAGWLLMLV
jgi:hypothetical protein